MSPSFEHKNHSNRQPASNKKKTRGGSVMIRRYMAANVVGNLEVINGILDKIEYLGILNRIGGQCRKNLQENYLFQHKIIILST